MSLIDSVGVRLFSTYIGRAQEGSRGIGGVRGEGVGGRGRSS